MDGIPFYVSVQDKGMRYPLRSRDRHAAYTETFLQNKAISCRCEDREDLEAPQT